MGSADDPEDDLVDDPVADLVADLVEKVQKVLGAGRSVVDEVVEGRKEWTQGDNKDTACRC